MPPRTGSVRLRQTAFCSCTTGVLEKLHMAVHVLRRAAFMHDEQRSKQCTDRVLLLMAITDTRMFDAAGCQTKEIVVVCDDDATLSECVGDLLLIRDSTQTGLCGGGDVHTVTSEPYGDGGANTLVKMKANHHRHPCQIGPALSRDT